uniref:Ig-like domain-containing protein n=1 Tax=Astyanax mexicanus TaxID=7994 RepID=A0A3B1JT73_ASTMX
MQYTFLKKNLSCIISVFVSEPFKVVGPNSPLVAETGEELVLPCSPQSSISAVDMTVKWIRPDRSDKLVHLYEGYEERNEKQIKSYRGRTSLFKEDLKNGNASLKLSALQPSDEGSYQCYIEYGQIDNVNIHVKVKGKNQHDHHRIVNDHESGEANVKKQKIPKHKIYSLIKSQRVAISHE